MIEDSSVYSYSWLEIEISGQLISAFALESLGFKSRRGHRIFW